MARKTPSYQLFGKEGVFLTIFNTTRSISSGGRDIEKKINEICCEPKRR